MHTALIQYMYLQRPQLAKSTNYNKSCSLYKGED